MQLQDKPAAPGMRQRLLLALLASPLHRLVGRERMILAFDEQPGGRYRRLPVSYLRDGRILTVCTGSRWWRHLRSGTPVTVTLQGRAYRGTARPLENPGIAAAELTRFLTHIPRKRRFYGVQTQPDGTPHPEDITRAIQDGITILKIELDNDARV